MRKLNFQYYSAYFIFHYFNYKVIEGQYNFFLESILILWFISKKFPFEF